MGPGPASGTVPVALRDVAGADDVAAVFGAGEEHPRTSSGRAVNTASPRSENGRVGIRTWCHGRTGAPTWPVA